MWSLASWVRGKGRDEEKAKTARQPDMAEGQRQPRVTGYSPQRKKAAQLSPKASETVGVVGTPHRQQQVEDAELPWERVEHEDLQKLQVVLYCCSQLCVMFACGRGVSYAHAAVCS